MDANDSQTQVASPNQLGDADVPPVSPAPAGGPGGINRAAASLRRVLGRRLVPQVLTLLILVVLVGSAYVVAAPPSTNGNTGNRLSAATPGSIMIQGNGSSAYDEAIVQRDSAGAVPVPASTGGPLADTKTTTADGVPLAALDATQIVKTGSMALEVSNIDEALTKAQAAIKGLGGNVSNSSRSNNDYVKEPGAASSTNLVATLTFRIPVAKWDDALSALHGVGSRLISENSNSTDVTTQVVDVDARIANLRKTEAALQSIMTQATKVEDILAIQRELTTTRGQIEQYTAQSEHLKDQAAMSTLTVSFTLPVKPNTVQATEGWSLGAQVDEAGAALVRVGQGLATMAVWAVVVILPIGIALLVLLAIAAIFRRILRRGRKDAPLAA